MSAFVERALVDAGLGELIAARRAHDLDAVARLSGDLLRVDLLLVGALADLVRAEEVSDAVRIHPRAGLETAKLPAGVMWIHGASALELLRAVAIARVTGPVSARVGVDWAEHGLELSQVALGFGASDLAGPIQKKSGLVVLESDARKVKGQGMVPLASLKRQEIKKLVETATRTAVFVDEAAAGPRVAEGASHA